MLKFFERANPFALATLGLITGIAACAFLAWISPVLLLVAIIILCISPILYLFIFIAGESIEDWQAYRAKKREWREIRERGEANA